MKSHSHANGNATRSGASRNSATRSSAPRHGRSTKTTDRREVPVPHLPARANKRRGGMSQRTLTLADLKLRQIEDAFLDTLLDAHPRRATALDRLLDDLAAAPAADPGALVSEALPEPDPQTAAASARRIESSLLAAVIDHHPRRDVALDRLLEAVDSAPAAAHGAWVDDEEECRRAEYDVFFDTDFDGLG